MVRDKKKTGKKGFSAGIKGWISAHKGITTTILLVILVPMLIWGIVSFGGVFELPPEEFQTGYATINFGDPFTNQTITDVDIYVQFWNGTNYLKTESGVPFYVPEVSWYFAVKSGFWNTSGAIWASGATPEEAYVQTYSICRICPIEKVQFIILTIDGIYGTYTSEDISDGYHDIHFAYSLLDGWADNSTWGSASASVPDIFIPEGSLADQWNISRYGLWIGWNGTISDYTLGGSALGKYKVYNVGKYNSTKIYPLAYSGEIWISGIFKSMTNATLYYGFIDDVDRLTIPF